MLATLFAGRVRVESENRQKNSKALKREEDPYAGSTDENMDAEQEQDRPIPDLPG